MTTKTEHVAIPRAVQPHSLLPIVTMLIIICISLALAQSLRIREDRLIMNELDRTSQFIEDELYREIDAYVMAVVRMAKSWSLNGAPKKAVWEEDAKLYVRHFPGMSVVQWIDPSLKIKWFVPYQGNEQLTNVNLGDVQSLADRLHWARDRNRPVITGSMSLPRGGKGFYIFAPIMKGREFHGYFGAVMRAYKFFGVSLANVAPRYVISIEDGQGEKIFLRHSARGEKADKLRSNQVVIKYRGATWSLLVSPSEGLVRDTFSVLPFVSFLTGFMLSILVLWAMGNAQKAYRRAIKIALYNEKLNREIIERKHAEAALGESEKRFRELVENIREVFWAQDISALKLLYLSPACETVWGKPPEYYYQNPNAWADSVHPDDRKRLFKTLENKHSTNSFTIEFRILHEDGGIRWIRDRSVLVFEEGSPVRRIGISEDITARKEIEEKLNTLNKAFECALEGVSRMDSEGKIQMANEAFLQMFDYSFSELEGSSWDVLFRKDELLKLKISYDRMCHSGKSSFELQGLRRDAHECFEGQIVLVKCSDEFDHFQGFYCFVSDISEHKRREAVDAKSKFISTVSHELRTPLHAVQEGINVVLEDDCQLAEEQIEMLELSKRNVTRLSRLINKVLDFQKLDARAAVLKLKTHDINNLLIELKGMMDPLAKRKGLEIRLDMCESLAPISIDYDLIIQVLVNIVSNAIKFTDQGTVTIRSVLDTSHKKIVIETEDTGIGISGADVVNIFRTFGQVRNVSDQREKGSGLGLAIAKTIVEQHQGSITVRSTPGSGSLFRVELPYYGGPVLLKAQ